MANYDHINAHLQKIYYVANVESGKVRLKTTTRRTEDFATTALYIIGALYPGMLYGIDVRSRTLPSCHDLHFYFHFLMACYICGDNYTEDLMAVDFSDTIQAP